MQQQMLTNFKVILDRVKSVQGSMSTREFARKLGMTQQTVALYLTEQRKLSLDFIVNICLCFGVSADWLLGLRNEQSEPAVRKHEDLKSAILTLLKEY